MRTEPTLRIPLGILALLAGLTAYALVIARYAPEIIGDCFPADMERQSILGHSMGGHGALTIAMSFPGRFRSVSAFSPICNPTASDWGRKQFTTHADKTADRPPDLVKRLFAADAPNRLWLADITYCSTWEGWLYVAVVLDLFSRRIVGWAMRSAMTADLVTDALTMALWRRGKPRELLHHSDRGSQYTSEQFQRLMADNGVTCSMSRSGNVWDNAAMESFFSSLKTERIGKKVYRTRAQAKADVFDYIECFYNPTRRHSTLGYLSPIDFEMEVGVA